MSPLWERRLHVALLARLGQADLEDRFQRRPARPVDQRSQRSLKAVRGTFSLSIPVRLTPQGLGVIALAGLAYFVVNYTSIATAVALSEGIGVRTHFRRSGKDLLFQGSIDTL